MATKIGFARLKKADRVALASKAGKASVRAKRARAEGQEGIEPLSRRIYPLK